MGDVRWAFHDRISSRQQAYRKGHLVLLFTEQSLQIL